MNQTCRQCQSAFEIDNADLAFYEKVSPILNGKKELIPPPTLCPQCRSVRRMMWRNERSLYTKKCDLCGKNKVSAFTPDSPLHTYCHDCFFSDAWDGISYGRPVDFSVSFFENLSKLFLDTPIQILFQTGNNENCDYMNFAGVECKNCYLIFNSGHDEDCYYSRGLIESKDCMDMLIGSGNELCYECTNCSDNYHLLFSQNSAQCSTSAFLFNCRRCKHCFGCTNLVEKEYHLFNQPCTKEEFEDAMSHLRSHHYIVSTEEKMKQMRLDCIHRATNNINTESCTGDYIVESKNCTECYEAKGAEDCKWMTCSKLCKDSYDLFGFAYDSELLYECVGVGLSNTAAFSFTSSTISDSYYCLYCDNVKNCFGCVSLMHKEYCILNKQYTKEEYEELVPKIIEKMRADHEYGEFLPQSLSPFSYNETIAQEYFPSTKEAITEKSWRWSEYEAPLPHVEKIIKAQDLPDTINDTPDDILHWAIECEATKRPFKILKQELDFYRNLGISIPRLHPDERHRQRMKLRNPCTIWNRACAKCQNPIATSYAPDRTEIVYCESCYLETVY